MEEAAEECRLDGEPAPDQGLADPPPPPTPGPTGTAPESAVILTITVADTTEGIHEYDRSEWKHWTDADGDALTFAATASDPNAANPLEFHGTLTIIGGSAGSATVTVTTRDSDGNQASDQFQVAVVAAPPPNQAPTVSSQIGDVTIVAESGTQDVSLTGVFTDADSDALTITATSSDESKATVSVNSDYSTLTVTAQARGTATITVTAEDQGGNEVSDAFEVTVKPYVQE